MVESLNEIYMKQSERDNFFGRGFEKFIVIEFFFGGGGEGMIKIYCFQDEIEIGVVGKDRINEKELS